MAIQNNENPKTKHCNQSLDLTSNNGSPRGYYSQALNCQNKDFPFNKNNNLNSYVELFRKCVNIDSRQHNWFDNKKKKDKLFLVHFNIRSLQKHIDELNTYLVSFKNQPEIVALSETKLRAGAINRNIHLEGEYCD